MQLTSLVTSSATVPPAPLATVRVQFMPGGPRPIERQVSLLPTPAVATFRGSYDDAVRGTQAVLLASDTLVPMFALMQTGAAEWSARAVQADQGVWQAIDSRNGSTGITGVTFTHAAPGLAALVTPANSLSVMPYPSAV